MNSSSPTSQGPSSIETVNQILIDSVLKVAVPIFFYGINTVLYCISIRLLNKRPTQNRRVYVLAMTALFTLSTIGAFLNAVISVLAGSYRIRISQVGEQQRETDVRDPGLTRIDLLLRLSVVAAGISGFISDAILLSRCYIIWNRRTLVMLVPAVFLLLSDGALIVVPLTLFAIQDSLQLMNFNVFSAPSHLISVWHLTNEAGKTVNISVLSVFLPMLFSALTHLLLTGLIAGKIFSVIRKTRGVVGEDVRKMYSTVMAVVVESGMLYPVALIALLAFRDYAITFSLIHIHGIAPALIIVRIGLGTAFVSDRGEVRTGANERNSNAQCR